MVEDELTSDEEDEANTKHDECSLGCVMCREKGSRANPLGQVRTIHHL